MTQRKSPHCGSPEHGLSRRRFLGSAAAVSATMAGVDLLAGPAVARQLRKQQKRVIMLWLAGGASQLETWDPKPGAETGGPFRAIPTSVPGVHISELMPKMAQRMQHTCLIRSLSTGNGDHGGGAKLMLRGRRDEPSLRYPDLGAVLARELGQPESQVPDYVAFYPGTEGRGMSTGTSGFLGARYAPMQLHNTMMPENIARPGGISPDDHAERAALRDVLSEQFSQGRSSATLYSHAEAYSRVPGLMGSDKLFDIEREPASMRQKYGPTLFGEQTLIARRLAEAGVPFVRVGRGWWDSHGQNFETHQEMVPELDHVMAALLDDLQDRGMLESTLVVTLAEFGRTPRINASLGRDHFANAWSCSLSGCGIQGGAVWGKTDEKGNSVVEGKVGAGELFATIYEALGIRHDKNYYVGSRPIPLVDPGIEPIEEILA